MFIAYTGVSAGTWYIDDVSVKEVRVADASPNGNHGVNFGSSIRNHGGKFDGSSSKVDLGSAKPSDLTGDLTVSAWIKPTGWGGADAGRIISNEKFMLYINTANDNLQIRSDGGTTAVSVTNSIVLNTLYHVLVTRPSAGSNSNIYINGVLNGTANQNTGTPAAGTTNTFIGNNGAGDRAFDGNIADVKIFNRLLSTTEITNLYQGKSVSGAILDMPLSDKTGFNDISGNGYNGLNTGVKIIGDCASFNGTSDYIDIGNSSILTSDTQTISFYLINKGTDKVTYIFDRAGNVDVWGKLGIVYQGSNFHISANAEHQIICAYSVLNNGDFLTVVFNYPTVTIYQNGVVLNTLTFTAHFNTYPQYKSAIGRSGEFDNYYFDGSMDNFKIYNRALSAAEVKSLFEMGRNGGKILCR